MSVFESCHYIRIAKSVKTSKMVQLHGCLKPTINEFEYLFGLKYQRSWCNEHIRAIFTVSSGKNCPNQETGLGNCKQVVFTN